MLTFWIVISFFFLLFDIFTSSFIFFCFSIGGVASIILLTLGYNTIYQVIVFCAVSIICVIIFYPITRKIIKKSNITTLKMEDKYVGQILNTDQDIFDKAKMKIFGIYWTVVNSGEKISKGEKFIITGIDGNKILIKKYKEE